MGFFDKLFGGKSKDENTAKFTNQSKTVLTPLQGKVLAQADIPDETFAQGILGPGCGIEAGDTVVFDSVSRMSRNAEEGLLCTKTFTTRASGWCS